MRLTGWVQRHRAAVYLAAGLLLAGGIQAMRVLPAGAYPEAIFPRIVVLARGASFEPRDMVVAVTRPLEEAISGVIDLRRSAATPFGVGPSSTWTFGPGPTCSSPCSRFRAGLPRSRASCPTASASRSSG